MSRRYPTPEEVRAFALDPDADLTTSALECDGNPLVCDDHGCEMARSGRPCPFRVTPRERVEALGWVPFTSPPSSGGPSSGWVRAVGDGTRTTVVCSARSWPWEEPGVRWYVWTGGSARPWFATEDEALEHALLLLDVWLS